MTDAVPADPVEPDNPAAYALARHIADHPVSTVQAAFRYLNSPLTIELHEAPDRAAIERVRSVLESKAVVGRSALDYRGLVISALMAVQAQQPEAEPCGAWGGCPLPRGHNMGQADVPSNHRPPAVGAQQPEAQAECNTGVGWYEVIHPRNATTCIAYAHEDGSLYLPEGDDLTPDEFAFAAAQGNAHRLVRADEVQQPAPLNIQCTDAFWLRRPHVPHDWPQRHGVRCPGVVESDPEGEGESE